MSKIYYLCPDFERPSGGTRELYWHVWQLRQQGLEAWILHQKKGFRLTWHNIDVPIISFADSPVLNPTDVLVLPEVMSPALKQLSKAAVRVNKVILAMNWHPNYWQLAPGDNWTNYEVQAVLTPSVLIADYVRWQMNLPVTTVTSYVDPKQYFYDGRLKQPIIAYITQKTPDAATLQGILDAKPGCFRQFRWQAIADINEADYAHQLRQASVYLASSFLAGANISVLEAMASGCLVVGYHGVGGREFMVGEGDRQNCILVENGNLPAFGLALEQVLRNWHNDPKQYDQVVQNAIATARAYQNQTQQAECLATFYRSLLHPESPSDSAEDVLGTVTKHVQPQQTNVQDNMALAIADQREQNGKAVSASTENAPRVNVLETVISGGETNIEVTVANHGVNNPTSKALIASDSDSPIEKTSDKPPVTVTQSRRTQIEYTQAEYTQEKALESSNTPQKTSQSSSSRSGRGFGKVTQPRKGTKGKSKGKKAAVESISTLVQKASQLRQEGYLEESQALYKQAFEIDRTIPELWFNYGNLLQQLGQPLDAEDAFRQATSIRPEFFQAHLNLANLLRDRHQIEDAITHYRHVIQLEPRFSLAYHNLGQILMEQHRSPEAVEVFMIWAQADPKNPVPLNGLGIILQCQGRYHDAVRVFEKALTLDPERSDSLNNLGTLLRMLHRPHDALPYLRQAIAQGSISDTTLTNLIHTLLNLGQVGEALSHIEQILEQYPNTASGPLMQGLAQTQLAQNGAAIASFQRAWELEQKVAAISNALLTLLYRDDVSEADVV
ncbi:MAG: tetratricopeptide repeat protein, partial [Symploca sp. SIO2B6]|nr:tetratricopeptide repeat protein [Symploca sp. SIO2B6]